jgi:hypothetical protein
MILFKMEYFRSHHFRISTAAAVAAAAAAPATAGVVILLLNFRSVW